MTSQARTILNASAQAMTQVMRSARGMCAAAMIATGAFALLASPVAAQMNGYGHNPLPTGTPVPLPAPGIIEKPNALIPLDDLEFTTSAGKKVKLAELYNQHRPVILQLVYFSCPNLCGFSQDDLAKIVRDTSSSSGLRGLKLGKDYDIVVVSIDPDDTQEEAAKKRSSYLNKMSMPESQSGFTYLTGREETIKKLADTVGFGYRRNYGAEITDANGKFAHSGAIFVTTGGGRLSQTIQGINYSADTVHYSLMEASGGKIGAGMLGIGLSCGAVHFDPATGTYRHNPWFWAGFSVGGASLVFMTMFLGSLWLGEARRRRALNSPNGPAGTPAPQ